MRILRSWWSLLVCTALQACAPDIVQHASYYRTAEPERPVAWAYAHGAFSPPAETAAALRAMGERLVQGTVLSLYTAGELGPARAAVAARIMQQPVRFLVDASLPADQAVLVSDGPSGIVADACRGPGQRSLGGLWPRDDGRSPVLLPPGCALAATLAIQATNPRDLLQGQRLPPGAALPYAAAIERYYHRFDGPQAAAGPASGSGGGGSTASGQVRDPAQANPLLGPLPAQPSSPAAAN